MIAARALSFGYRSEAVLDDFTVELSGGQLTAVSGVSGRGKSTLLYLFGLLLRPWSGQVEIDGQDVTELSDAVRSHIRATEIGFVFQDASLDPTRTVLDNIVEPALYSGLAPREARRRATEMVQRFSVDLRLSHRPGEVSGGQAQRVALCRALVNRPGVVLADEPTGNLDPASAAVVLDALHGYARSGATVVVASHDPQVLARADEVLSL